MSHMFQVGSKNYGVRRIGNEITVRRGEGHSREGVLVRLEGDSVKIDGRMGRKELHCNVRVSPTGAEIRQAVIHGVHGPRGGQLLGRFQAASGVQRSEYESFGLSVASTLVGVPLNLPYCYEGP